MVQPFLGVSSLDLGRPSGRPLCDSETNGPRVRLVRLAYQAELDREG